MMLDGGSGLLAHMCDMYWCLLVYDCVPMIGV